MLSSASSTAVLEEGEEKENVRLAEKSLRKCVTSDSVAESDADDVQAKVKHQQVKVKHHWLVESPAFNLVIGVVVLINIIQMGLQLDLPEYEALWLTMENLFTAVFLLEMITKLVFLGLGYFEDKANWLDMIIVFLSVIDCWVMTPLGGDSGLQKLSIFRFIRLFRLVRLAKLVKQIEPLVVVMSGVVEAVISTFWVSLVLLIAVYVCGIFCTEYIGNNAEVYPGYSTEPDSIDELEIISEFNPYLCFGSLPKSMLTLFSISISGEWAEIVRPVAVKQPFLVFFFMAFVMFVTFGVMNVIVGMIVDNVFKSGVQLQVDAVNNERAAKRRILKRLENSLKCMNAGDDKGDISLEDLRRSLELNEVSELLDGVQLPDHMAAQELFYMLDCDGDGKLEYRELKTNFLRLVDSNEFQQLCLLQTGINHIKSLVLQVQSDVKMHVEKHICGLANDLRSQLLAAHLSSAHSIASESFECAANETGARVALERQEDLQKESRENGDHEEFNNRRLEVGVGLQPTRGKSRDDPAEQQAVHPTLSSVIVGNTYLFSQKTPYTYPDECVQHQLVTVIDKNAARYPHVQVRWTSGFSCWALVGDLRYQDAANDVSAKCSRYDTLDRKPQALEKCDPDVASHQRGHYKFDAKNSAAVQECRLIIGNDMAGSSASDAPQNRDESSLQRLEGEDSRRNRGECAGGKKLTDARMGAHIDQGDNKLEQDSLEVCFQHEGQLGLKFDQTAQFLVNDLKPGGLAIKHGLQLGDKIALVNGKSTCGWTFEDMKKAFGQRPLRLTLLRERNCAAS